MWKNIAAKEIDIEGIVVNIDIGVGFVYTEGVQ